MKQRKIGDKLRTLRKAKRLTAQDLADKVNISQSYISRFENNRAIPDIEMLERILIALDSDLATFFSSELDNTPPDLVQLINTVKTLSPAARIKLNEFLNIVTEKDS
ncbi:helix-turn-helix domain-containing protein [Lederbergia sp. NSJ-179]|uniref:helix-turn-helix domain-containing protein n=1 Tax=Lederbergia sp. NSJ-179 TaxID=2931402 RepID=UPI001FD1039F|nr:helix-turn-helix transcriptional regulator [Lederbergia sp. NSJ-179]MCJ7842351.1 helix-turn-helix domain-containing protein [Lederbergia sp. NSJ-179]